MMGEAAFRSEERIGLLAALLLHGALLAVLLVQTVRREVSVFRERMTGSLVSEVGLEAASPDPVAESRAALAPELAEQPALPAPQPAARPAPEPPQARPQPRPEPRPQPRASPKPEPKPEPTRAARPSPAPSPPAPTRERSRPDRTPAPAARSTSAPSSAPRAGGSRIGEDFLEGRGSSTTTSETRAPAATFGRAERAALSAAITRQLRPHWSAPSGLEAELLVSTVSWELNRDGTLKGVPRCRTSPDSITESNRPQAPLHCERAIRAVQRAVPFNLPEQFYDRWKALEWQFDRRL
jgi:protein TonB